MSRGKPALPRTVYLALGANLGDRQYALEAAVERLGASLRITARSALYETDAVADEPQPPYLNAVVRAKTDLPPRALLRLCLAVERALGRVRPAGASRAPRTIDIDILLDGAHVIAQPGLRVPHPRMLERAFVRVPLADVAEPGLRHPITGDRLDRAPPDPTVRRTTGWQRP